MVEGKVAGRGRGGGGRKVDGHDEGSRKKQTIDKFGKNTLPYIHVVVG